MTALLIALLAVDLHAPKDRALLYFQAFIRRLFMHIFSCLQDSLNPGIFTSQFTKFINRICSVLLL